MKTPAWLVSLVLVVGALVPLSLPAPPASADACIPLDEAAITYGAASLAGQVPAMSTVCYSLPETVTNALTIQSDGYTPIQVVDAGDHVVCAPGARAMCPLAGTGPWRVLVVNSASSVTSFNLTVWALGTCPDLQVSGFGASASLWAGKVPAGGRKCRDLTLSAGTYLLTGWSSWGRRLVDAHSGEEICQAVSESDDLCTVTGGVYDLLVGTDDYDSGSYSLALVALDDPTGCSDVASTTWSSPPIAVGPLVVAQWDCHILSAAEGDRFVIEASSGVYGHTAHLLVLDGDSQITCPHVAAELGCTLSGPGPYRIVTGDDIGYRLVARSLADDTDCPVITPRAFGKVADDVYAGVGCRRFVGVAGHSYYLMSLSPKGKATGSTIYGPDFARLGFECDGYAPLCRTLTDGTYWVIWSSLGRSTVTAFVDLAANEGCKTQAADLSPRSANIGIGEFDCAKLDLPSGATVGIVRDITRLNAKPLVTIVDSAGEYVCSTYYGDEISLQGCRLTTGVAPYRAVVGLGLPRSRTTTAYLRLDKPRGCAPLKQGKSATVKLSAKVVARCYVASQGRVRNERLSLRRTSGKAIAELGAATGSGGVCSPYVRGASMTAVCLMLPVTSPFTVVVTGNRKPGTFVLKRGK